MTPRRAARGVGLALAAAVLLGPVAACSEDEPELGQARLEVDGTASILRQAGEREEVTERADVRVGDQVTLTEGTGRLLLRDDVVLELRSGTGLAEDTRVVMGAVPLLERGDLLVLAPGAQRLSVDQTEVEVLDGAARIARALGVEVAAYEGSIQVDSAGQEREVPALRQVLIPALGLPEPVEPLRYDPADLWDRRFLGDAIELGDRLEALAAGYTQNLAEGEGRSAAFFRQVLPALVEEAEFTDGLLDAAREPGETLVGAAIAVLGTRGEFTDRWEAVFAFRDEGAAWGLVARDQGVDRTPLLGSVTDAVDASPLAIAPIQPPQPSVPPPPPTTSPTTTRPPPGTAPPTTPPTTEPPPGPSSPDGGLGPILAPVLEPVGDLVTGLVHGLLDVVRSG